MKNEFSIAIPTFNEHETIFKTIKSIEKKYPKAEIIIIDDSQNNKTVNEAKKASKKINIIKNKKRVGLSGSVLEGIKQANFEFVIITDSDLQHPLDKIDDMLKTISSDKKIEIVLAERKNPSNTSYSRNLSSKISVSLANLFLALRGKKTYTDPVTGFFCVRKNLIDKIDERRIVKKGWKISFDLIKQVDNEKVGEVFFSKLNKRTEGKSKFGIKPVLYFLKSLLT
jgi:dolichol-phosphate mannosyltransferase